MFFCSRLVSRAQLGSTVNMRLCNVPEKLNENGDEALFVLICELFLSCKCRNIAVSLYVCHSFANSGGSLV